MIKIKKQKAYIFFQKTKNRNWTILNITRRNLTLKKKQKKQQQLKKKKKFMWVILEYIIKNLKKKQT